MKRNAVIPLIFLFSAVVEAQSPPPPAKTAMCTACHGEAGISANDLWPNIAGQKEQYLVQQLLDYKRGARVHPLMTNVAKSLTDAEIRELAAYYAGLKAGP